MTAPWLDDGDVRLYHGGALEVLRSLPADSVQTCVTSPPYWGLRDYGVGDAQLGLEVTPAEYVAAMVAVFAEVWRVLRADGTLWLNLGDSYASNGVRGDTRGGFNERYFGTGAPGKQAETIDHVPASTVPPGLKAKDLVGIPWRVAFALQEAGWYLRSDVIWSKPNPMPESVVDRPTKAHEYVFLLAKQPRYFYDADAIREPPTREWWNDTGRAERYATQSLAKGRNDDRGDGGAGPVSWVEAGRNARSVWEIATQPTPEAHFATFPEALVRRCILAGTSEAGACRVCAAPWVRQVDRKPSQRQVDRKPSQPGVTGGATPYDAGRPDGMTLRAGGFGGGSFETMGWAPTCSCGWYGGPPVPQTVLDPFVGSGTTALVARKHGRRAIGIDLSGAYLAIAARRLGQQSLFATGEGVA